MRSDAATDDPGAAASSTEPAVAPGDAPHRPRPRIHTYPTVKLDPREIKPTWPIVIASLEQLSDWAVFAFRLGTLALIQACVRELAQPNARADLIVRLRALTEALAHMPLEA